MCLMFVWSVWFWSFCFFKYLLIFWCRRWIEFVEGMVGLEWVIRESEECKDC